MYSIYVFEFVTWFPNDYSFEINERKLWLAACVLSIWIFLAVVVVVGGVVVQKLVGVVGEIVKCYNFVQ